MEYGRRISKISEMVVPDQHSITIEQQINIINKLNTFTFHNDEVKEESKVIKEDKKEKYVERVVKLPVIPKLNFTEQISLLKQLEAGQEGEEKNALVADFKLEKISKEVLSKYLRTVYKWDTDRLSPLIKLIISKLDEKSDLLMVLGDFLSFLYLRDFEKYKKLVEYINTEMMLRKCYLDLEIANRFDAFCEVS